VERRIEIKVSGAGPVQEIAEEVRQRFAVIGASGALEVPEPDLRPFGAFEICGH